MLAAWALPRRPSTVHAAGCLLAQLNNSLILPLNYRTFSLSICSLRYKDSERIDRKTTKYLQKLSGSGKKTPHVWHASPAATRSSPSFAVDDTPRLGHLSASARRPRAEQLAKVLQADIVQLISVGSLGEDYTNVQVSEVRITADLNNLNVYWVASGGPRDDEMQEKLSAVANKLRSLLISLRPIGRVPTITFVRDLSQSRQSQIDFLIDTADKGPADETSLSGSSLASLDSTYSADVSGSNIHTISDAYGVDRSRLLGKLAKGSRLVREVAQGTRSNDSTSKVGSLPICQKS